MGGLGETLLGLLVVLGILIFSGLATQALARAMYLRCRQCGTLNAHRRTHCRNCGQPLPS